MKKALIISGGQFDNFFECDDFSKKYSPLLHIDEYGLIIAADKGAIYAKEMGIRPNMIIGDFDSALVEFVDDFKDIQILKYPVMKDDTDTMLAIKQAINLDYKHITIVSALGNRMDHTISNLQSLNYIANAGGTGEIISNKEHLITLGPNAKLSLEKTPGHSLSIFSLTDLSQGVTIEGTKYEVKDVTLTNHFPLGHGNSILSDKAEISVKEGILLIVESKLED